MRSIRVRLGAIIAMVVSTVGLGAAPARAAEGWSCSFPPPGYTFVGLRQLSGVCGSPWPTIQYNLRLPVDGLTACSVVEGWAVTSSRSSANSCALTGTAFQHKLATPVAGLWSCNVPRGWTYSQQRTATNVCGNGTFPMFQLAPL
ncbi:hypothetical protein [Paractinoplanes brasiliensis]|uniref:Subtilisin inhibitor-like n=1 Tax=Paractinoplanes brasiliensis TaxID=52695 RepID=A0A4R6J8W2_9ACTN|nr:hypothetical protein [Actinoplanes brasiliensis]TDO31331.1 hypothetical protein C8E87_6749 [Actinoplanes brasiliensis]GID28340.1 hypothetical protein Abr02nite_33230 [Actinoplanes brasiliensis]